MGYTDLTTEFDYKDLITWQNQDALAENDAYLLAGSVAGNGLTGGGGSALAVNVDNSTIEINADIVRLKDGGTTEAKLATAVQNKLGQNIGLVAFATTTGTGSLVNYSGQGRLKGIVAEAGGNVVQMDITIDGVAFLNYQIAVGDTGFKWGSVSNGLISTNGATLNDLDIHFRTSLVISIDTNASARTVVVAYERAA